MNEVKLLEFLRSSNDPLSEEFLSHKNPRQLRKYLEYSSNKKEKLLSILRVKYGTQLNKYMDHIYSGGRSKYQYITDGIDFITHLRTKCRIDLDLYMYITELYAQQQIINEINLELAKRVEFEEIDLDKTIS